MTTTETPTVIHLALTTEEAQSIRYALTELANRRSEQAIDMPHSRVGLYDEADKLRKLAYKIGLKITV